MNGGGDIGVLLFMIFLTINVSCSRLGDINQSLDDINQSIKELSTKQVTVIDRKKP